MTSWSGVAEAYRRSFATLCAGTIDILLAGTEPSSGDNGLPARGRLRHLDAGCGTGQLALAAARCGRDVVAADKDPDMAALTRATAGGIDDADPALEGRVRVLEAGPPASPCPAASFDAIGATRRTHHMQ